MTEDDLVLRDEEGKPLEIESSLEIDWIYNGWLAPYWSVLRRVNEFDKNKDENNAET